MLYTYRNDYTMPDAEDMGRAYSRNKKKDSWWLHSRATSSALCDDTEQQPFSHYPLYESSE